MTLSFLLEGLTQMMRKLAVAALTCVAMLLVTSESFAGARGKSFKIDVDDGTKAAVAFNAVGFGMLVHVPDADVPGTYFEVGNGILFPSFVLGVSVGGDYVGFFLARCADPLGANNATMTGSGIGTTGPYTFKGAEKN